MKTLLLSGETLEVRKSLLIAINDAFAIRGNEILYVDGSRNMDEVVKDAINTKYDYIFADEISPRILDILVAKLDGLRTTQKTTFVAASGAEVLVSSAKLDRVKDENERLKTSLKAVESLLVDAAKNMVDTFAMAALPEVMRMNLDDNPDLIAKKVYAIAREMQKERA